MEHQVGNNDDIQKEDIGRGLMPIRCLGVFRQVLIRDGIGLEGGVFFY